MVILSKSGFVGHFPVLAAIRFHSGPPDSQVNQSLDARQLRCSRENGGLRSHVANVRISFCDGKARNSLTPQRKYMLRSGLKVPCP